MSPFVKIYQWDIVKIFDELNTLNINKESTKNSKRSNITAHSNFKLKFNLKILLKTF